MNGRQPNRHNFLRVGTQPIQHVELVLIAFSGASNLFELRICEFSFSKRSKIFQNHQFQPSIDFHAQRQHRAHNSAFYTADEQRSFYDAHAKSSRKFI